MQRMYTVVMVAVLEMIFRGVELIHEGDINRFHSRRLYHPRTRIIQADRRRIPVAYLALYEGTGMTDFIRCHTEILKALDDSWGQRTDSWKIFGLTIFRHTWNEEKE